MDLHEFDNVKWDLRALFGLIVLSQSNTWVPIVVKSTGHFFQHLISIFNCHFYVFILFNAIIFVVYAFSIFNPINDSNKKPKTSSNLYDEFVFNSTTISATGNKTPVPGNSFEDKQVVSSENAVSSPPIKSNQKDLGKSKDSVSENVEKKGLLMNCYRRTQSETYKRSETEMLRPELQRSNTNKHRELKTSKAERRVPVDGISNEEFNRRIEAFITTQKWIQREESREERKTECGMAISY